MRWEHEDKLIPSDGWQFDRFGHSVAVSGDVAVVGAPYDDHNGPETGSAYVFRYDQVALWPEEAKFVPPITSSGVRFGSSVSLGDDMALIGAEYEHFTGGAYVFRLSSPGAWSRDTKLLASDGQHWDYFGHSISLSDRVALIGAYGDDDNGNEAGSAYLCNVSIKWYVDDDNTAGPWYGSQQYPFQHIQDGIDAASNGESVIVMPGIYPENIDFIGKAIVVKSDQGASVTTIDGGQAGSVIRFGNNEAQGSVIEGFTITNGTAASGGGIYCGNSSPTVTNNIITGNSATLWAYYNGGGGIFCWYSSPTISNNIFYNNWGNFEGGAIYLGYSSPIILNNTIDSNRTEGSGGGIECAYNSDATISNNTFISNEAYLFSGGGLDIWEFSPTVSNNLFKNNFVDDRGGGISCRYYSFPMIINNTVVENSASAAGGGIHCNRYSSAIVANTVLWGNSSPSGAEVYLETGSVLTISFSDVAGGQASVYVEAAG